MRILVLCDSKIYCSASHRLPILHLWDAGQSEPGESRPFLRQVRHPGRETDKQVGVSLPCWGTIRHLEVVLTVLPLLWDFGKNAATQKTRNIELER